MRARIALMLLWFGSVAVRDAHAQALYDPTRAHVALGTSAALALPGDFELRYQYAGEIPIAPVDADAREGVIPADDSAWVRLRLSPALTFVDAEAELVNVWRLAAELDLLRDWWHVGDGRGVLAVDPRGRADEGLVGQRLSQLYFAASGEHLGLQAGLVRSRWGLGLVSNAADDPRPHTAESPFGQALQGDHVVRLGVSAFPLGKGLSRPPLTASLAVDGVIDDDTARWSDGDRAYQLIAAVLGQTDAFTLGLYGAHRVQDHHQGGTTEVTVLDLTGRVRLAHEEGLTVFLEGELATIRGRTSLPQTTLHEGSLDVAQLAGLLRFAVEAGPFLGVLEVGAASGDDHPFDDEQRAFAMDRDHRVGLLLFREAVMAGSAVTVANIADDDYRARPPRGTERIATAGAVRGAIYANPRVSFALTSDLHLYAGFLWAESDGEVVDAFWSGLVGGAPRGFRNGRPASDLGWEVDLGIAWRIVSRPVQWRLRVEGGWLQPGAVFDDEAGRSAPGLGGLHVQAGLLW